ncbi:MAG: pyridoxamine 5'-phosphate oxidase family protein [Rhodospirillaceae bacterium]
MARIETEDQLRDIYPEPTGRAAIKVLPKLETHSRRIISLSPFVLIATQGKSGSADVSPKGDMPGFVQVIDDNTIAIPDRPGNNRIDGMKNIIENPHVGLIFLIPGVNETLRVNGDAEIRDEDDLLKRFEVNKKLPRTVMVVRIREVFMHCAKALVRSKLWDPASQIDRANLPTISRIINEQAGLDGPEESQEDMMKRYKDQLY